MTLPVPNLDDRSFLDLVAAARERAAASCPGWTDLSVHDPGTALLEVFAHLTEVMLYRLNRLPEKAYLAFLNLLGVTRHPPAAASVDLVFSRIGEDMTAHIPVPAGSRVAAAGGSPVFVVTGAAVLPAGAREVTVRAHHCDIIEGEVLGIGTGLPGQRLAAARAPIAVTTEPLDLLLGVEVGAGELPAGAAAREHDGRIFEIWTSVTGFAEALPGEKAYLLDRAAGTVTFAPVLDLRDVPDAEVRAAVPAAGRQVRLWYRTGGGAEGNVSATTLTRQLDPVPGTRVTNPEPARGGRSLESIDSTLARGPYELFSARRAVTARDFELLAIAGAGGVERAKAFTRVEVRPYARPGEVEVVLVPDVPTAARPAGRLPMSVLLEHQAEDARLRTEADMDARRALGTRCVTSWARYKEVAIKARVVVRPEEDREAVRDRIHDRLHQTISPLTTPANPGGWQFGEPLRASNVYRMLEQAEPGVRYVEEIRFVVGEAPDTDVRAVAADPLRPGTWYAGCGELLFRSTNDGQGWEPVGSFPGETVRRVVPAPAAVRPGMIARPGVVAVVTRKADGSGSPVRLSPDMGETWRVVAEMQAGVTDIAWIDRDPAGAILLATDVGLYELSLLPDAVPVQIVVDAADPDRGFYAVDAVASERGRWAVAVAAQAQLGVAVSVDGVAGGMFRPAGLTGVDTRALAVQLDGPATVLWAGAGEPDPALAGQGCFRARLFEADVRWEPLAAGWVGGTCWAVDFIGRTVVAATQSGGVLTLDGAAGQPRWTVADVNCGLPLRDRTRFEAVAAVATAVDGDAVLVGGPRGLFRSTDLRRWQATARRETRDMVTLPGTWLLCSGEHEIEVVDGHA